MSYRLYEIYVEPQKQMKIPVRQRANKQILEIPMPFRISAQEVHIKQVGNSLVLIPADKPWEALFESLALFSDGFFDDRKQPEVQSRNFFG